MTKEILDDKQNPTLDPNILKERINEKTMFLEEYQRLLKKYVII
jgi:hypothetical protein